MARKPRFPLRLVDLTRELAGVEKWLLELRHNRGRWPRAWCKSMIRHYDDRRMKLRAEISRIQRKRIKKPKRTRKG